MFWAYIHVIKDRVKRKVKNPKNENSFIKLIENLGISCLELEI